MSTRVPAFNRQSKPENKHLPACKDHPDMCDGLNLQVMSGLLHPAATFCLIVLQPAMVSLKAQCQQIHEALGRRYVRVTP